MGDAEDLPGVGLSLCAYDADGERMLVYNASNGTSVFRIRRLDNKPLREVRYSGGVWSWGKDWIYRDGSLLATVAPGADGLRYVHADHLGSPRLFTDASGLAREKYHYYPFGEQAGSAPATPEAMRFTGHERDPAASTGTTDDLDYMHARYCNPQLGRFLGADPKNGKPENPQSWNRYVYAVNNPVKYVDPDGEAIDTFLDIAGLGYDIYELVRAPSWKNAGILAGDVVLTAVPFVPNVGAVKLPGKGLDFLQAADGLAAVRQAGAVGEAAVRKSFDIGQQTKIVVPGTNRVRIPDGINRETRTLSEVKNVAEQGYTQQLRDFAAFAQEEGLTFVL